MKTFCEARTKKIESGENIDWATAEALAIGSLLLQGRVLCHVLCMYEFIPNA